MTVFVNAILYYKVKNATHAVANVDDYSGSARLLAATTLRNVLGTLSLGDILSQRETIAREMQSTLDDATEAWGVQVERVEVGLFTKTSVSSSKISFSSSGERCEGAGTAHEGHGCRGRSSERCKSKGNGSLLMRTI